MRTRVLPKEEWGKLNVTGLPEFWEKVRHDEIEVVVVEDGDRLVASIAVTRAVWLEGLWIDEQHRGNAGVARRLINGMLASARPWSDLAFGVIAQDHVRDIAERSGGVKLPGSVYVFPLSRKEETRCA